MTLLWIAIAVAVAVALTAFVIIVLGRRRHPPLSEREAAKLAGQKAMRGLERQARRRRAKYRNYGPGIKADGQSGYESGSVAGSGQAGYTGGHGSYGHHGHSGYSGDSGGSSGDSGGSSW